MVDSSTFRGLFGGPGGEVAIGGLASELMATGMVDEAASAISALRGKSQEEAFFTGVSEFLSDRSRSVQLSATRAEQWEGRCTPARHSYNAPRERSRALAYLGVRRFMLSEPERGLKLLELAQESTEVDAVLSDLARDTLDLDPEFARAVTGSIEGHFLREQVESELFPDETQRRAR